MLLWRGLRQEKTCELPDGNIITVGAQRFRCAKVLFQPNSTGKGATGFHDTNFQYNTKCDADTRKDMYANVVSSGGTASFLHEGGLGILRSIFVLLSELYF